MSIADSNSIRSVHKKYQDLILNSVSIGLNKQMSILQKEIIQEHDIILVLFLESSNFSCQSSHALDGTHPFSKE